MERAPTAGTTTWEKYSSDGAATRRRAILSDQEGKKNTELADDDTLLFLALSSVIVS